MTAPNWPGTAGGPAVGFRSAYARRSLQLPFATGNSETDAPEVLWGPGSPEGAVVAVPGDIYLQTIPGTGPALWQKITGTSTTGWFQSGVAPQVFDTRVYGAKGDGVTDDTVAIQAAITACAAAGGGIVYLSAGTYLVVGLSTTSSGVTLVGAGYGATTIKAKVASVNPVASFVGVSLTHISGNGIQDLTIHGNSVNVTGLSLKNLSRFSLRNVYVVNVGAADGIYIEECWDSLFTFPWVVSSCAAGFAAIHIKNGAADNSNTLYFYSPHLESITGDYIWMDCQGAGGNNNNIHFEHFHIEKGSGTNARAVFVDNQSGKSQEEICFESGTFVQFDGATSGCIRWENVTGSGHIHDCFFNNNVNAGVAIKQTAGTLRIHDNRFFNWTREIDHGGVAQSKCQMLNNLRLSTDGRISVVQEDTSIAFEYQGPSGGFQPLTNNSTTPSIAGGKYFSASNSSTTSITDFTNPGDAQEITILFTNGNTTIVNGATIALAGAANFVGSADDMLTLVRKASATKWYEKSRSVN